MSSMFKSLKSKFNKDKDKTKKDKKPRKGDSASSGGGGSSGIPVKRKGDKARKASAKGGGSGEAASATAAAASSGASSALATGSSAASASKTTAAAAAAAAAASGSAAGGGGGAAAGSGASAANGMKSKTAADGGGSGRGSAANGGGSGRGGAGGTGGAGGGTAAAGAPSGGAGAGANGSKRKDGGRGGAASSRKKKAHATVVVANSSHFTDMCPDLANPTMADLLKPQTPLQAVPASERAALFVRKLRLCCVLFDFDTVEDLPMQQQMEQQQMTQMSGGVSGRMSSPDEIRAKEVKRVLLLELLDCIGKTRAFINEAVIVEILRMVAVNLFRSLPVKASEEGGEMDEEEPIFEPAWPHLQFVYEFFLRFMVSNDLDVKVLKKHVGGQFILHILELFDSEDPRERDYLKTILHRMYAKFMSLRAFIRKAINNTFFTFIYESESHNGVAELLEILGSIINGFALPLKQEHKLFLRRVLIPMHVVKEITIFHHQLSYCVTQFVNKDPALAVPVIMGMVKLWPNTNSAKEVLFLNELEEVLELTQTEEFKDVMVPLFERLSRTIGSPHFQVAERALFLWHNEYISGLVADHRNTLLPILYRVLHDSSEHHWNATVTNLTQNVLKFFSDMDAELVEECHQQYIADNRRRAESRKAKDAYWAELARAHDEKVSGMMERAKRTAAEKCVAFRDDSKRAAAAAAASENGESDDEKGESPQKEEVCVSNENEEKKANEQPPAAAAAASSASSSSNNNEEDAAKGDEEDDENDVAALEPTKDVPKEEGAAAAE